MFSLKFWWFRPKSPGGPDLYSHLCLPISPGGPDLCSPVFIYLHPFFRIRLYGWDTSCSVWTWWSLFGDDFPWMDRCESMQESGCWSVVCPCCGAVVVFPCIANAWTKAMFNDILFQYQVYWQGACRKPQAAQPLAPNKCGFAQRLWAVLQPYKTKALDVFPRRMGNMILGFVSKCSPSLLRSAQTHTHTHTVKGLSQIMKVLCKSWSTIMFMRFRRARTEHKNPALGGVLCPVRARRNRKNMFAVINGAMLPHSMRWREQVREHNFKQKDLVWVSARGGAGINPCRFVCGFPCAHQHFG